MSYAMNEIVTDLENPPKTAGEWIPSLAGTVAAALKQPSRGISAVIERGRILYMAVGRRLGKEANAVNSVMREIP